jgi:hypothetical protein
MSSVIDVAVDVLALSALHGVSLQTLRSRLPPLQAAPPPEAGVSTPRDRTCRLASVMIGYICRNYDCKQSCGLGQF